MTESVGQEARIMIKRSMQKVDQEWLVTILRKMKMKKRKIPNPWNAFRSAFAEPPFDVFYFKENQVAMVYWTMKDHLARHAPTLTPRPIGSLWDFVPPGVTWMPPESQARAEAAPVAPPAPAPPGDSAPTDEIEKDEEEEISLPEDEDVSSQWVKQMMKIRDAPMPLKHKVANIIVALLATTLAVAAAYLPTGADSRAQLQ